MAAWPGREGAYAMVTTGDSTEARFEELETRIAFQEDMLQKLDEALVSQQKQIFDLQARLQQVTDEMHALAPANDDSPDSERPPHY